MHDGDHDYNLQPLDPSIQLTWRDRAIQLIGMSTVIAIGLLFAWTGRAGA